MSKTGRTVHDLPPSEDNKRNSEGAFITLNDGRLLFAYSRYGGEGFRDDSVADIAVIYSADDGESWSEPQIIFTAEEHKAKNIMSVSLLRLNNGDIGLFYLVKFGFEDTRLVIRRSKDEGVTWSDAEYCIERLGFNVVNNDRVIMLESGRIIFPSAHHAVRIQPGAPCFPFAVNYFYISDDDGESWYENDCNVSLNSPHTRTGLQEPGILELAPGFIWCWSRTDMGRQYEYFSRDGGLSWSNPEPSYFVSPCSPLSIKRIPGTEKLLAVWNPIPEYPTYKTDIKGFPRKRFLYSLSRDNGGTWDEPVVLEDDDGSGYCYTAIHFHGDSVLLAYCAGHDEKDYSILSRIRIRKIPLTAFD
ncbi:MAG: sialidase family protein [Acutalibacteraceae bacterium]|jgi:predicted neuraminidase